MSEGFNITDLWCGPDRGVWALAPGSPRKITKVMDHQFLWVCHGKITWRIQGKAYSSTGPKNVLLTRPGQTVGWDPDPLEPTIGRFFHFNLCSMPDGWPSPDRWPIRQEMPADDIIRPLFEYVVGHMPAAGLPVVPPSLVVAVRTMVLAFIHGSVDREYMLPGSYPPPLRHLLDWMREFTDSSPARKTTLEDLAAIAGVSRVHLCRLFHEHLGYTPLDVLYIHRVVRSLTGLRAGQKIESLAHEYGFASASHFSRRFKSVFGKVPGEMQKAMARNHIVKLPHLPFL